MAPGRNLTHAMAGVRRIGPPTAKSDTGRSHVEQRVEVFNVAFVFFHALN